MTTKAKSRNKKPNRNTNKITRRAVAKKVDIAAISDKSSSKRAQLAALLRRPEGASIAEATVALGWQAIVFAG